jgi:hypothetical protein
MKTAYELLESQVSTPPEVISLFWKLIRTFRRVRGRVLDLGAGDGRFAWGGHFKSYDGIEIDKQASAAAKLPKNAKITNVCAFKMSQSGYDLCIGNPPYVRHHDIERPWRKRISRSLQRDLGIVFNGIGNLYLYFFGLALAKTADTGLVALLIPFEWVSRPSAKPLREFLQEKQWKVSVYRFEEPIFEGVLTTASIVLIDKADQSGDWSYYNVNSNFEIAPRRGVSGNGSSLLSYSGRDRVWARRGISPGGQKTFTLTEDQRLDAGLRKTDMIPCVTTLKHLPSSVKELTQAAPWSRVSIEAVLRARGA